MGPNLDFKKFWFGPIRSKGQQDIEVVPATLARWECLWRILNWQQCWRGNHLTGEEFGNKRSWIYAGGLRIIKYVWIAEEHSTCITEHYQQHWECIRGGEFSLDFNNPVSRAPNRANGDDQREKNSVVCQLNTGGLKAKRAEDTKSRSAALRERKGFYWRKNTISPVRQVTYFHSQGLRAISNIKHSVMFRQQGLQEEENSW